MKSIAIIGNENRASAEAEARAHGWRILSPFFAEAYYVLRDWRDNPEDHALVRQLMADRASIYWHPNKPPDLTRQDFAKVAGVKWQETTKPTERNGRRTFQAGVAAFDGVGVVEIARKCGHKVSVAVSKFSDTTVVATIYASGKRTFYLKLFASNRTQAANIIEEISKIEMESMSA